MSKVAKFLLSPVAAVVGLGKKPKLPAPTPAPTRDDYVRAALKDDPLRKRRGGAADILTGAGGAEAAAAGVKSLVGQ
jgi:hypothetical protein